MPEIYGRSIPTYKELVENSDGSDGVFEEPTTRLLGKSLDTLQTSEQRLEFMDSVEEEAYALHEVMPIVHALLGSDSNLTDEEKADLADVLSGKYLEVSVEDMIDAVDKYQAMSSERVDNQDNAAYAMRANE